MRVDVVDGAVTRELRRAVLRPGRPADALLPGDDQPEAVHVAAFSESGALLSTCFVYADPPPWDPDRADAWHLRQMATEPAHRRRGAGAAVLAGVVDVVARRGGGLLWCHARTIAEAFYAGHGFLTRSDVHLSGEPAIPHVYMARTVDPQPASQLRAEESSPQFEDRDLAPAPAPGWNARGRPPRPPQ